MKKTILALAVLAMALCCLFSSAAAEDAGFLGKAFPDFTVTDSQGNTFTLSAALQDHEAVLLNIWATWCGPCRSEFPYLNEAWETYGSRVAFIALSCEDTDTAEVIESFRGEYGIPFPMGRDEGSALLDYVQSTGIPTTVIIDRFGNAAFVHVGSFRSAEEISRVLEVFLGDGYTETAVLDRIPVEASTQAFPVSAERALHVENENAEPVLFHLSGYEKPFTFYVVPDATAHLRAEIAVEDNPGDMILYESLSGAIHEIPTLLDADSGSYLCDVTMPGAQDTYPFVYVCLQDGEDAEDSAIIETYLIMGEEYVEELAETLRSWGMEVSWEYGQPAEAENAEAEAYILHVADQYGSPVPEVTVSFCTDTACVPVQSDENGTVTFTGAAEDYHVQVIDVPEGYSCDDGFEMRTGAAYGEWKLRIRKTSP